MLSMSSLKAVWWDMVDGLNSKLRNPWPHGSWDTTSAEELLKYTISIRDMMSAGSWEMVCLCRKVCLSVQSLSQVYYRLWIRCMVHLAVWGQEINRLTIVSSFPAFQHRIIIGGPGNEDQTIIRVIASFIQFIVESDLYSEEMKVTTEQLAEDFKTLKQLLAKLNITSKYLAGPDVATLSIEDSLEE